MKRTKSEHESGRLHRCTRSEETRQSLTWNTGWWYVAIGVRTKVARFRLDTSVLDAWDQRRVEKDGADLTAGGPGGQLRTH